jgi:hypothetical protein
MKNILISLFSVIFIFAVSSCDKIEKPEKPVQTDELNGDTVVFPVLGTPIQKVLLEEFTGHTCVNCPTGHKKAADLKALYEDTLVVVAIHAGYTAEPVSGTIFTADYRTEAGNELCSSFSVPGNPSGLVNRTPFNGSTVLLYGVWAGAIKAIDRSNPPLAIQLKVNDYPSEKRINVFAKSTFLQDTQKNYKLTFFLIEDSIVSPQSNNSTAIGTVPEIVDYMHQHMLRGSINSVWGTSIATTSAQIAANTSVVKGYNYSFDGKIFVKSNCSVIAVVYDVDTKKVVQVEETHL